LVGYLVLAHGSRILCICTNLLERCMLKRQDKLHRRKKNTFIIQPGRLIDVMSVDFVFFSHFVIY
jgi:hypothetical protein